MRLALLCDYAAEEWPSMDLCADMLEAELRRRDDVPNITTLRHARIPLERADAYRRRLLELALEFVDEPHEGDVEFGLYVALYPTSRTDGLSASTDEAST